MKNYERIQHKVEILNEIELVEVIDFIDFLHYKKMHKQKRLEAFKALQNANVAEKYGDALTWQKETRQDNVLTR